MDGLFVVFHFGGAAFGVAVPRMVTRLPCGFDVRLAIAKYLRQLS
jgi:hypothetical protein